MREWGIAQLVYNNYPTGSKIQRLCPKHSKNLVWFSGPLEGVFAVQGSASPLMYTNVAPWIQGGRCQFIPTKILSQGCVSGLGVSACRSCEGCRGIVLPVAGTTWAGISLDCCRRKHIQAPVTSKAVTIQIWKREGCETGGNEIIHENVARYKNPKVTLIYPFVTGNTLFLKLMKLSYCSLVYTF